MGSTCCPKYYKMFEFSRFSIRSVYGTSCYQDGLRRSKSCSKAPSRWPRVCREASRSFQKTSQNQQGSFQDSSRPVPDCLQAPSGRFCAFRKMFKKTLVFIVQERRPPLWARPCGPGGSVRAFLGVPGCPLWVPCGFLGCFEGLSGAPQ